MVLQGTEAIIYLYVLNDRSQKFEVNKIEFTKGADNYRIANDNENENEEEQPKEQNEEQPQEMQEQSKEQEQEQEQTKEEPVQEGSE